MQNSDMALNHNDAFPIIRRPSGESLLRALSQKRDEYLKRLDPEDLVPHVLYTVFVLDQVLVTEETDTFRIYWRIIARCDRVDSKAFDDACKMVEYYCQTLRPRLWMSGPIRC